MKRKVDAFLVIRTHVSRFAPDWDLWRSFNRLSYSAAAFHIYIDKRYFELLKCSRLWPGTSNAVYNWSNGYFGNLLETSGDFFSQLIDFWRLSLKTPGLFFSEQTGRTDFLETWTSWQIRKKLETQTQGRFVQQQLEQLVALVSIRHVVIVVAGIPDVCM